MHAVTRDRFLRLTFSCKHLYIITCVTSKAMILNRKCSSEVCHTDSCPCRSSQWFLANLSYQEALSDTQVAIVNILSSTSGESSSSDDTLPHP